MIKQMGMGCMSMQMEMFIEDNGSMMKRMVKERRFGLMVLFMKVIILMAINKGKENRNGQICPLTLGNGFQIK